MYYGESDIASPVHNMLHTSNEESTGLAKNNEMGQSIQDAYTEQTGPYILTSY